MGTSATLARPVHWPELFGPTRPVDFSARPDPTQLSLTLVSFQFAEFQFAEFRL